MIPAVYRNVLGDVAADQGQTDVAFIGTLADETATFADDTLTMNYGYKQDDDGDLLPNGLIAGLIQTCVLDELETPPQVQEHIDTTRALDGTQEDSWGDYQARWTYPPGQRDESHRVDGRFVCICSRLIEQADHPATGWPRSPALHAEEVLADADLLFTAVFVGVAGTTCGLPRAERELEPAVVAVAGVDRPVAAGLADGELVPRRVRSSATSSSSPNPGVWKSDPAPGSTPAHPVSTNRLAARGLRSCQSCHTWIWCGVQAPRASRVSMASRA